MTAQVATAPRGTHAMSGLPVAIGSAAAFGLSGPMATSLLHTGWSPGAVVLARIGGAALALLVPLVLLLRSTGLPSVAQVRRVVAYGIVAVALTQLCYFNAVQRLSVGVALLLEYLAPVLLIGWHWMRTRRTPARGVLIGAAVAMAGMILVLDLTGDVRLDPVGVLWALGAAVCLAGYFELATGDSSEGAAGAVSPVIMTAGGLAVGAVLIAVLGWIGLLPMTYGSADVVLAGTGLPWWVPMLVLIMVTAVIAYLTGILAIRALGSSVASFVALAEVIFAVAFAVLLVGQRPSMIQLLGGVLVLAGIALVRRRPRADSATRVVDQHRAGARVQR